MATGVNGNYASLLHYVIFSVMFPVSWSVAAFACTAPKTPIGPVARIAAQASDHIHTAFYDGATTRYGHAVLGDAVEGTVLTVVTRENETSCGARLILDDAHVFEDLTPRLVDLDGDRQPEVITVRSHRSKGAQVAIYGLYEDALKLVATTPYIGQRYRWLAPVGAADLDRDGNIEIAYIDRPHLAKVLRVWRFQNGTLKPVARLANLTNHRIGENFITGGIRTCGGQPEMITVDAAWSVVLATTLNDAGRLEARIIGPMTGPATIEQALTCGASD